LTPELFVPKLLQYLKEKKDDHIKEEVGAVPSFKPSKYTMLIKEHYKK
jgi:hypothetical protein